jgi:hypothetical protein
VKATAPRRGSSEDRPHPGAFTTLHWYPKIAKLRFAVLPIAHCGGVLSPRPCTSPVTSFKFCHYGRFVCMRGPLKHSGGSCLRSIIFVCMQAANHVTGLPVERRAKWRGTPPSARSCASLGGLCLRPEAGCCCRAEAVHSPARIRACYSCALPTVGADRECGRQRSHMQPDPTCVQVEDGRRRGSRGDLRVH